MALSTETLVETAFYLEQHDEGQRIKKLVFCLCKKYWENDPNVLNSQSLGALLQELVELKPNIEQLTFSMYKLVKTLNRPKVYAAVAKMILDRLAPIYDHRKETSVMRPAAAIDVESVEQPATFILPPLPQLPPPPAPVQSKSPQAIAQEIAQILSQHPEQARIKKLMYAVGKGHWENNLQVIDNYGFTTLILELHQRYTTSADLGAAFDQIVENINKATLYLAIAKLLLTQLSKLYDATNPAGPNGDVPTGFNLNNGNSLVRHPSANALAQSPGANHQETSIVNFPRPNRNAEPLLTVLGSVSIPPSAATELTKQDYNLFELRAEIMQYSNPLRAKILLFSVLFHSWDTNGQDWGILRSYGLDDLIEQVLKSQKPSNEVELKLYAQAKLMSEVEVYTQTATTLIKVLKPLL